MTLAGRNADWTVAIWGACLLCLIASDGARGEEKQPFSESDRSHWSYQPLQVSPLPPIRQTEWLENPIDHHILARLEKNGLAPSPEADRRTLIRRATMIVWGIPPTPEEVEAFVQDREPQAYERLIDRLLASPRYGEKWARHWLDLAHYAESDGYKQDLMRPDAWRYRDYVVDALNADKPYDRFVAEQIAGDELYPGDSSAAIATGFLRFWPYEDNGRDLDRQWASILNDVTDTSTQVFLGLTVRCARCHDHKFDAILQADYFRLQAFFSAMAPADDLLALSPQQKQDYETKLAAWEEATKKIRAERDELSNPFYLQEEKSLGKIFPDHLQPMFNSPPEKRTPYERQLTILAGPMLKVEPGKMSKRMPEFLRKRWDELGEEMKPFDVLKPKPPAMARGVRDIDRDAPVTRIPDVENSPVIAPGFLTVLDPGPAQLITTVGASSTGRRATLAKWLTDPKNPLPARVQVNRLWQHHFGKGLVGSSGDFGVMGDLPSHPELLDWLASEFINSGWSLKHLHRLMLTSATFRQASVASPTARGLEFDGDNRLLWRMNSQRIEAEILRDAILGTAGTIDLGMHGESVMPELPHGLTERYAWKATPSAAEQHRRSIYLVVKRNTHLPLLKSFDLPDSHDSCTRRDKTTTATQALVLWNDDWPFAQAKAFAARVIRESNGTDTKAWITRAYERAFARVPTAEEMKLALAFFGRPTPNAKPQGVPRGIEAGAFQRLTDFCHVLINSNEFLYFD